VQEKIKSDFIGMKNGQIYRLSYIGENQSTICAKDSKGNIIELKKSIWERGPKYKPLNQGDYIECIFIDDDVSGNQYFDRVNIDNPYYCTIEEIINDKYVIEKTFNSWNKDDDPDKRKMYTDYNSKNANWILSFSSLLRHHIKNEIKEKRNYDDARKYLNTHNSILEWIKTSGFLLTQGELKREKSIIKIRRFQNENYNIETAIKIITNDKVNSFLVDLNPAISACKDNPDTILENKIYLLSRILGYAPPEFIPNSKLEDIIDTLRTKNLLFEYDEPFFSIRVQLTNRRKYFRKKIFSLYNVKEYAELENSSDLRHFIFLKKFEVENCEKLGQFARAQIEESTVEYLSAIYTKDIEVKHNLIRKAINALQKREFKRSELSKNEDYSYYKSDRIVLIGRMYEFLAYISSNRNEIISLLREALQLYSSVKFSRSYLVRFYLDYNNLMTKIGNIEPDKLKREIKPLWSIVISGLDQKAPFPQTYIFDKIYRILSVFGEKEESSLNSLFDELKIASSEDENLPNVKKLAGLVLANNLLSTFSDDNYHLFKYLKEYLLDGQVKLPLDRELDIDDKDTEIDHEIFSEEIQDLELKGSCCLDINRYIKTGEITEKTDLLEVLFHAVVGMLNASGGTLYVGVLEADWYPKDNEIEKLQQLGGVYYRNRIILGIEPELKMKKVNSDKHMLNLMDKMRKRISNDIGQYVTIKPDILIGRTIYQISIREYPIGNWGAYFNDIPYLRENNQTMKKTNQEFNKYLMHKHELKKQNSK